MGLVENIVEKNVALMTSTDDGGMYSLTDSIGATVGYHESVPCWATNFYFDLRTGEILEFNGNRSSRLTEGGRGASFRLTSEEAYDRVVQTLVRDYNFNIVDFDRARDMAIQELAKTVIRLIVNQLSSSV